MVPMADRTVSVRLTANVQSYLRNTQAASAQTARLTGQLEALDGKKIRPEIVLDVDEGRIRNAVDGVSKSANNEARRRKGSFFSAMFTPNPAVLRTLRTGIPAALSSPIGTAGLVLGGVFAASFAGAVVSAGLIAGVGAGFTGLAAVALRENERVKQSFDELTDSIQADLREAAAPMIPAFDAALSQVRTMFGPEIRDPLEDIFEGLAPSIVPAAESAVQTLGNVLDSLATPEFLEGMETILGAISDQAPRLGTALGDALVTIAENADDVAEAFEHVVTITSGLIRAAADITNHFTNMFNDLAPAAIKFGEILRASFEIGTADVTDPDFFQNVGDSLRDAGVPDWLLFTDAADSAGKAASRASGDIKGMGAAATGSGDAALTAAARLEDYKERAEELGQELRLLSGLRRDSLSAEIEFEQTVADTSQALIDAESAVADARSAAGDAARDAAEAERRAQQRIADAQEGVTQAREDASRAAEQAAEQVANAEERLADAQGQARIAQEGLTQARRDAAQALRDMREQVSDLALSEEAAEIGLIEAQQRLAELNRQGGGGGFGAAEMEFIEARRRLQQANQGGGGALLNRPQLVREYQEAKAALEQSAGTATELERRKALLAVAQAEDRLADVRRDQAKATDELSEAERRGIEGSDQVVRAKERIADANEAVRDAQEAVTDAIEDERRTQEDSAEAIRDAIARVDEARRNAARTAEESAARIADANRRVREAEQKANEVRESVRQRLIEIAEAAEASALALFEETGSQREATGALQRGRDELIKAGVQYGLTRRKAKDYADQILGTPDEWTTIFKEKGLDGVSKKVEDIADKIIDLEDKTITITANGSVLVDGKRAGGRFARGGPVDGPGTSSSDSVPIWASDGEYVMRASARRQYGDSVMDSINAGQLAIGGPGSNTVRVQADDNIKAADFGLMAAEIAGLAAEAGMSAGRVLPSGAYRVGRGSAGHGYPALDLPAPFGTPVYAMASGIVSRAMELGASYGIHAFLDHPGGRESRYAHLSSLLVGLGDEVRKGELLGRVGSTGNSTGNHLHFEYLLDGMRLDPRDLGIFHRGGMVGNERGAVLQQGEFVVQRPAVQSLGVDAMQQINQGRLPSNGPQFTPSQPTPEVRVIFSGSGDRWHDLKQAVRTGEVQFQAEGAKVTVA